MSDLFVILAAALAMVVVARFIMRQVRRNYWRHDEREWWGKR